MAIAEILADTAAPFHGEIHVGEIQTEWNAIASATVADRARPNLKIQDGCSNRCSFCIIPSVRGRSRSAPADHVVRQVLQLSQHYTEVVLTGINLGRWGKEAGMQMRLSGLLRRLLDETPIQRLRLSSVEPMDFSDDLLQLIAESPRIAKHVHAPLQSGSDSVLRRMRRKYRPRHYEDRIRKARELMPEAAIGADVMAGFPGESEAEFRDSYEFIDRLPFTYLHVFPYSERPGTPAAQSTDQVPVDLRRKRARMLSDLAAAKNRQFRNSMVGRTLSAVVLESGTAAVTSNYLHVELASPRPPRELVDLTIGATTDSCLREKPIFQIVS
jgi:threonylcarbamoyladenosine tRNA methylthiotransferase MtaB